MLQPQWTWVDADNIHDWILVCPYCKSGPIHIEDGRCPICRKELKTPKDKPQVEGGFCFY